MKEKRQLERVYGGKMRWHSAAFFLFSFLAGAANGLLGAGGGIVLLLAFRLLCKDMDTKTAFATSCVAVFFFSAVSCVIYAHRGTLSFVEAEPYMIPALIGGVAGALLLRVIRVSWLKTIFALILIYGGARMVLVG